MTTVPKIVPFRFLHLVIRGLQKYNTVLTNGCFDILHAGHVSYLQEAKLRGDILIVGINSDASVRALKGEGRPVNDELDRAFVLSALGFVDFVTVFDGETVEDLLRVAKPNTWVKGGDYTVDTLNPAEKKIALDNNCEIVILQEVEGKSTTNIIDKIKT
jgi:D-beta-D-heptose 7-phosphate kinase/D-beta-D-heptose 1-phosphate adenosyltransferase